MARIEGVAGALPALREARNSPETAQLCKSILSAAQYLMRIGLMSHIPDDFVLRGLKRKVHRHREFHDAEVTGEMTSGNAGALDQKASDLLRQPWQLIFWYFSYILRSVDPFQYHSYPLPASESLSVSAPSAFLSEKAESPYLPEAPRAAPSPRKRVGAPRPQPSQDRTA